ncbi:hypothetical protein P8452_27708 [Trifolium repens]|nr:hypothetical protein P8452_27708 [Trifolium repens]
MNLTLSPLLQFQTTPNRIIPPSFGILTSRKASPVAASSKPPVDQVAAAGIFLQHLRPPLQDPKRPFLNALLSRVSRIATQPSKIQIRRHRRRPPAQQSELSLTRFSRTQHSCRFLVFSSLISRVTEVR